MTAVIQGFSKLGEFKIKSKKFMCLMMQHFGSNQPRGRGLETTHHVNQFSDQLGVVEPKKEVHN